MAFSIKYRELFRMNILHLFFLNRGFDSFHSMSEEEKENQMDFYDFRNVYHVQPILETLQKLNGLQLVFKVTATGFSVWSRVSENDDNEPFISLEQDLSLTFCIQITDSRFLNYTNLKIENAGKLYYFSNRRLPAESETFPLISKKGGNNNIEETYILSDGSAKDEIKKLTHNEKSGLFGLIRIYMKGESASIKVTDSQGRIPSNRQTFELQFGNRSTWWRYIFNKSQTVSGADDVEIENGNPRILITKTEKPLTHRGFVAVEFDGEELPNPGAKLIKPVSGKIFSEIYM
jgi:hypothetical protein